MWGIFYDDKNESKNIIRLRNTVGIVRAIFLCSPFIAEPCGLEVLGILLAGSASLLPISL